MKLQQSLLLLSALAFLSFSSILKAQDMPADYTLQLKSGEIYPEENLDVFIAGQSTDQAYNGHIFKYIQFFEIPGREKRNEMESYGIKFIDYIPNNTYTVEIPEEIDRSVLAQFEIRSIVDILPGYKLGSGLAEGNYPEWSLRGDDFIEVIASFFSTLQFSEIEKDLQKYDAHVVSRDPSLVTAIMQIRIADIDKLASEPFVSYIEAVYPPPEPENYTGKTLHRSNLLDSEYSTGRHYDGTGIKVMLQDDGIVGPHIDFDSRIMEQYPNYNSGDHGDHITGIILGAGNLDPTARGMAPGAEMYVYSAGGYEGFSLIPSHYNNPGIRISSTSYGDGCNSGYTTLTKTLDAQIRMYPSLMHVFSTGNSGTSNCGYGAGPGWGNITGGHKMGKNVIAVANLDYKDDLSNSSSRGPATDGRIKPDLAAKGSSVYSTTDPNSYTTKSGTSMACPGVSGSFAQLYHAYKELNGQQEPVSGLIKAIALNTAEDLGNPGPDFLHGWGRINNLRAVKTLEENRYLDDQIDQGELKNHLIDVPAGTKELRIMAYWTDWEANAGANIALVNNINITVEDPSNAIHHPWILSHYPHPDSLAMPATTGIDNLNNMEQVSILDPAAGQYAVNIEGFAIPMGPQPYFVVFDFRMDEIEVTYPVGGESFNPQEYIAVRWDAFGADGNFTLEYSPDNGQNWTLISNAVSGDSRFYSWTVPQAITGSGLIRVSRNGVSGQSIEPFSVMHIPEDLNFDFSCPNSTQISWDPVQDAEYYEVFVLGDHYMESVGTSTGDSLVVGNISSNEVNWFSVRAVGPGSAQGRRSLAVMKEEGVWNCTFSTDVSASELIAPPAGVLYDCQTYDNIHVAIEISNKGLTPVEDIPVGFKFTGNAPVTETFTGTLNPGETAIYEFASQVSLASGGTYSMKSWVSYGGDENLYNDTTFSQIHVMTSQYITNEVLEDFDNISNCSYFPDCGGTSCDLDSRWYNLENYLNDQIDWRALSGITPTQGTGPIGDHTTGTIDGKFLYLEASGECYNREAILMSPCIDLTNSSSPVLSLWYHMHGEDMGKLQFDAVHEGQLIKNISEPVQGDQGEDWLEKVIDLSAFAGSVINIRIRASTGDGELSDIAIDDFMVKDMTTGIGNEKELSILISVVPNPTTGIFQVRGDGSNLTIKVTDLLGNVIIEIQAPPGQNVLQMDLSAYPNGVYLLTANSDRGIAIRKIVKQDRTD